MDKTPKSKHFGFKSKNQNYNKLSWFERSSKDDDSLEINEEEDAEKLSIIISENLLKTPPVAVTSTLNISNDNRISMPDSSPQYIVGWNDGSQKTDIEMSSPVHILPTYRRIRRCPESLLLKTSKLNFVTPTRRTAKEDSDCDILQCITWAKNLIESTSSETEGVSNYCDKDVIKITDTSKDTNTDDILDDSSNELMILCSQAIEEENSSSKCTPVNKKSIKETHLVTPENDRLMSKRFKNDTVRERLNTHDKSINVINNNSQNTTTKNLNVSNNKYNNICDQKNILQLKHECINKNVNYKEKHTIAISNNSNTYKPMNFNKVYSVISEKESNSRNSLSTSNNDGINSYLDDEDDLFRSFDLDSLQNDKSVRSTLVVPESKTEMLKPLTNSKFVSRVDKPLPKCIKEQIEKRRLEARKRLFSKKHKSM